ncbi:ATP-binding protein [Sediminispirochaeta smaragdinae]|uniref:Transcriptional regulator n=1 Tax=Sediminispirochaeta smaragdinae (strain DSM 11293 / JCM 15392 / SEBR 4228) TaxID=573413 RepID=E1RB16_SEDSS|nr:RNA-binding domain-containing protein [Sediminispirochaeta smaragdinae]ADK79546.1 putative transcriptional regulator [Sediminispirochaeta smaragdinae DSM 11293]
MEIIEKFIDEITAHLDIKKFLHINMEMSNQYHFHNSINENNYDYILKNNIYSFEKDELSRNYDLIFGVLPFGIKDFKQYQKYKIPVNYDVIINTLEKLEKNGLGIYTVEPSFFWSTRGKVFIDLLEEKSYFINFCIEAPKGIIPYTNIRPYLIGLSKEKTELFIGSLNELNNVSVLIDNYFNNKSSNNIDFGKLVDINDFTSISNEEVKKEEQILLQHYKNVEFKVVKDIIKSITPVKDSEDFSNSENEIYITKQGNLPSKINHKNFSNLLKIDVNHNLINPKYLEIYFRSSLGQISLKSIQLGSSIPYIRRTDLLKIKIPVPPLIEQSDIVEVNEKLNELKERIASLENEFSLNLSSSKFISEKIETTLNQISHDSINDRIIHCLKTGENKNIEYKESFSLNVKEKEKNPRKDKAIELSALKTIVGFLNSNGGYLLIGVDDNATIFGIEDELKMLFKNNNDSYLLYIKDKIKNKIGVEFFQYINYQITDFNGTKLLFIEVDKSPLPCCYEKKDFYLRLNPATEKLEGKELIEYIFRRFQNET